MKEKGNIILIATGTRICQSVRIV